MSQSVIQIDAGMFANVFLVRGQAGAILVDAGPPGVEERVLEAIAALGVTPGDLRLILITHGHTDHFGSAAALRERTGAPVAIHALDAAAVHQGANQPESVRPANRLGALFLRLGRLRSRLAPDFAPAFQPDVILGEALDLEAYGVEGHAIHTPGHTPGSVSVLLPGGEAIVGDLVMGTLRSAFRRPGPGLPFAYDLALNRESVRQVLASDPARLYVGHGGPFRPEDVRDVLGL